MLMISTPRRVWISSVVTIAKEPSDRTKSANICSTHFGGWKTDFNEGTEQPALRATAVSTIWTIKRH